MIQSFEDVEKLGNEVADTSLRSFASISKGMQAIAAEASEYSRRSIEQSSAALGEMVQVRSPESAVQFQMDLAKKVYEDFVGQAARIGELYADMAKEAYKPFETLGTKAG